MVIGGITDFVVDMVVKKAIPKLIAMFIPGAGFISAILSIYDTIMVFVNKISKIIQVVTGFIDSIVAIASGAIGAAAKRVENSLAGLLSLAISFLAGFVGLRQGRRQDHGRHQEGPRADRQGAGLADQLDRDDGEEAVCESKVSCG